MSDLKIIDEDFSMELASYNYFITKHELVVTTIHRPFGVVNFFKNS
jgi:hypothetical protein